MNDQLSNIRADIRQNLALMLEAIENADVLELLRLASARALDMLPDITAAAAIVNEAEAAAAVEALLDRILGTMPQRELLDTTETLEPLPVARRSNGEEHLR